MTIPNEEGLKNLEKFRKSAAKFRPSVQAVLGRLKNPDMDLINSPDNPYRKMKKDD